MAIATVLRRPTVFISPLDRCLGKLYILRLSTAVILDIFIPSFHSICFLSYFSGSLYSLSTDHTLLHFNFIAYLQSDSFLLLATNCLYPLYIDTVHPFR